MFDFLILLYLKLYVEIMLILEEPNILIGHSSLTCDFFLEAVPNMHSAIAWYLVIYARDIQKQELKILNWVFCLYKFSPLNRCMILIHWFP